VTCDRSLSVAEFKGLVQNALNIPTEQQRLIYKGKILKDDSTLEQYDIQDGHTIHLVKSGGSKPQQSSSPAAASAPASGGQTPSFGFPQPSSAPSSTGAAAPGNPLMGLGSMMGGDMSQMQSQLMQNPELMQQMLSSPMMESLLSNPEMMTNLMLNNPQLQPMLDANPQIRHILSDPALMRQTMQMMRNPNAMREAMRHQDLAMSHLENHPEGFNALRRMYEEVQEPMMEATSGAGQQQTQSGQQQSTNPWATGAPNTSALPNPWGGTPTQPAAGNGAGTGGGMGTNPFLAAMGGGMPGMGGGGMPGTGGGSMPGMGGLPGMGDPAQIAAMMQNPMVQQMLSDPNMIDQMARMNPQLGSMLQANPQLRSMLTNPDMIRQMTDPNNLQAIMQMQQSMQQLQRSGMLPAGLGFPAMPSMGAFQGTGSGGTPFTPPQGQQQGSTIGGLDFSAILGSAGAQGSTPASSAAPPAPSRSPEVRFESQLQQLNAMGFTDTEANIRALTATNGNVNAAVERLLQ